MPITTLPLLTITPIVSAAAFQQLEQILAIVLVGAFGRQPDLRTTRIEHADHLVLGIEVSFEMQPCNTAEIATRLAETMLQLIPVLTREIGVNCRRQGIPCRQKLKITGLAWHHARLKLTRLVSVLAPLEFVDIVSPNTELRLRISTNRSLGASSLPSIYLCDSVVSRRSTSNGDIVRIRCGRRLMSIAMPRYTNPTVVSDGIVVSTTPIVGLIPRRLVQVRRCQLSLLCDDSTAPD